MPQLSMNVTTTFHGTVVNDIAVAKAAGYGGIELQSPKLYRYLDAGYSPESLLPHLEGLQVTGLGAVAGGHGDVVLHLPREVGRQRGCIARFRRYGCLRPRCSSAARPEKSASAISVEMLRIASIGTCSPSTARRS